MVQETQKRVTDYFRAKTDELMARSRLAVTHHNTLRGTHRELVVDAFLRDVLPSRYAVGCGEIHGKLHHSPQCDIVLWDEQNFPRLSLAGSTIFFAEAVRAVIEVKSRWSRAELDDIAAKTKAIRDIVTSPRANVDDTLNALKREVDALAGGPPSAGAVAVSHRIGTAAFVVEGGERFTLDAIPAGFSIDDSWPDALLLLGAGRVVVKRYQPREGFMGGTGTLLLYSLGKDALLFFTDVLLRSLIARSVFVETPLDLSSYMLPEVRCAVPKDTRVFELERICPGRTQFFWRVDEQS